MPETPLTPARVLALQHAAGNRAVSRWMRDEQPRPLAPPSGREAPARQLSRCACDDEAEPEHECDSCRAKGLASAKAGTADSIGGRLGAVARARRAHAPASTLLRAGTDGGVVDAGTPSRDAGTGVADGGTAAADAGTSAADAGTSAADAGTAACALTTFSASNFVGESVVADVEFVDSLNAINAHAVAAKVDLNIRDSYREGTSVPGAIVTPATASNHHAGHAIDMNVLHGDKKDTWCNSSCLGGASRPAAVDAFIKSIQGDSGLRWGGDFSTPDPVHIDDNLNADAEAFKKRRDAVQAARKSGCG